LAVGPLVTVLVGAAAAGEGTMSAVATVGQKAPPFTLKDTDGKTHSLSDFAGKIVVLEWVNQKCPVSYRKHKDKTMQTTLGKFKDKAVVWLGIDSSHYADPKANQQYAGKMGLPYPILHDADGRVGKRYGATTTPHMFVIDAQGVLAYAGAIDDAPPGKDVAQPRNYVADAVDALLKGSSVALGSTKPYGCSVKYATK
jgi:peroxiredoxin